VEIAFASTPFTTAASTVWTDVTADVRALSFNRGRSQELDQFQAGTCTVTLSNANRKYDPTNAAGTYFGSILPNKRIRIVTKDAPTSGAIVERLFEGYVDAWTQNYNGPNDATCEVSATDGFKLLNAVTAPTGEYAGAVALDAPVAWFRLGEAQGSTTVLDSIGNRTANVLGAGVLGATSLVNFDQAGAYTQAGNATADAIYSLNPTIPVVNTAFSVECIFKWDTSANSALVRVIAMQGTMSSVGSMTDGWILYMGSGSLVFSVVQNGAAATVVSNILVNNGGTYHVICTKAAGFVAPIMWLDGVNVSSGATTGNVLPSSTFGIAIGNSTTSSTNLINWAGTIDEVALYNYVLTPTQVANHANPFIYNNGLLGTIGTVAFPGTRIQSVLTDIGWPSDKVSIAKGSVPLQPSAWAGTALGVIQAVAQGDVLGEVFMDASGNVKFWGRFEQYTQTSQQTFSDAKVDPTKPQFSALVPYYGDATIKNCVQATINGGVTQTVQNAASVAAYFQVCYTLDGLQTRDNAEALYGANIILSQYAQPMFRVSSLTFACHSNQTLIAATCPLELGQWITVEFEPQGVGSAITQVCVIEKITHAVDSGNKQWTVTFNVSPAPTGITIPATYNWEIGTTKTYAQVVTDAVTYTQVLGGAI
jgi:hypothetical protein